MTREEMLGAAGEYVLGLLDGADRQAFESAMRGDAELAHTVARLTARIQALDDTAGGTATPEMWAGIEARLATAAPEATVPVAPVAANENRRSPRGWMGIAASIVLAVGAGYLAGVTTTQRPQPTVVAVLLNQSDASPGAIIEAFGDDSVRLMPLEDFDVPEGSILQVWTLPNKETGPVSLGTLNKALETRLAGPHLPPPGDGQLYEITLEPAPGSPTGRPTGPVLVKGFAKRPI